MMTTDRNALGVRKLETALVENVDRARPMAATVVVSCLAKVVEEGGDKDAFGIETARMREHVVVHLERMASEASARRVVRVLAMVTVAPALEVVGRNKVLDDGVLSGTLDAAEQLKDSISVSLHHFYRYDST